MVIIYKTVNQANGKMYVGKDGSNDPNYLGSGLILNQAIKKYGRNNFKKETLEECTEDNWGEREQYWIAKLNSQDPKVGYNIRPGGEGFEKGRTFSPEAIKKLSEAAKRRVPNPETFKKISEAHMGKPIHSIEYKVELSEKLKGNTLNLGKHLSEETKQKISVANTGKVFTEEHRKHIVEAAAHRDPATYDTSAATAAVKGKSFTQDHKDKISVALKGTVKSDAHCRKLSIAASNKTLSDEHKRNIGLASKGRIFSQEARQKIAEAKKQYWAMRRAAKAGALDAIKTLEKKESKVLPANVIRFPLERVG